jgi:hypothetical protein
MTEPTIHELASQLRKVEESQAELSAKLKGLEKTARNLKNWGVIVGVVAGIFGFSLNSAWDNVRDAKEQAGEASRLAASSVDELKHAKDAAAGEIKAKGSDMLLDFKRSFQQWVDESESPLVPSGITIAFRGAGEIPKGWSVCHGMDSTVLVGTEDPAKLGMSQDPGEQFARVSEVNRLVGRPVSNITATLFHVRYICR